MFKVGDRVRYVGRWTPHLQGRLGNVTDIRDPDAGVIVQFDGETLSHDVYSASLELNPEVTVRPTDAAPPRKDLPLFAGCLAYFPDALLAVARLSKMGNDKHNPGEPLHWSKGKSADHADALARHLIDHGKPDPETGLSHTVAVAWRALALLQTEIEAQKGGGQ